MSEAAWFRKLNAYRAMSTAWTRADKIGGKRCIM